MCLYCVVAIVAEDAVDAPLLGEAGVDVVRIHTIVDYVVAGFSTKDLLPDACNLKPSTKRFILFQHRHSIKDGASKSPAVLHTRI